MIGISSFNSPLLSPQPLTWTIGVQFQERTAERAFFLGSAPDTLSQGTKSSQVQACSLFFEGVAGRLRFPGTDPEYDEGNCNDALTAACVNDLRKQSQAALQDIISNGEGDNSNKTTSTCDALGNALRDKAPASCAIASNGAWGTILARSLTNSSTARPTPKGNCHPTTDASYDLFQIASSSTQVPEFSPMATRSALLGVTPIMTIAYNAEGADDAEFDLTCLKPVGPPASNTTQKGEATPLGSGGTAALSLAIVQLSVFGLWSLL
ncbi:MAG: hypothetical protein Q9211_005073 [Gyalolechia sp. 1 TL-2023]